MNIGGNALHAFPQFPQNSPHFPTYSTPGLHTLPRSYGLRVGPEAFPGQFLRLAV